MSQPSNKSIPKLHKCIAIFWPSFLTAVVASGLFFSAFDPKDLFPYDIDSDISELGIYSIGFFLFWALTIVSGAGTLYFAISNCLSCTTKHNPSHDKD